MYSPGQTLTGWFRHQWLENSRTGNSSNLTLIPYRERNYDKEVRLLKLGHLDSSLLIKNYNPGKVLIQLLRKLTLDSKTQSKDINNTVIYYLNNFQDNLDTQANKMRICHWRDWKCWDSKGPIPLNRQAAHLEDKNLQILCSLSALHP